MHNRVRLYLSACFYYSGLVSLMRWWTQRSSPGLVILYYHQASIQDLRRHWLYLRRHYRILPLEQALEELSCSPAQVGPKQDRRTLLAVTFDDGYEDNYSQAFPLACELEVPITIFLIAGYLESGSAFWWATRWLRLAQVEQVSWQGCTYRLDQQEERKALAQVIDACFRQATSSDEREHLLTTLSQLLAVPSSLVPKEEPAPLLTWAQVHEMQASGWVSFGAHTIHHPNLGMLKDPVEVAHEVGACRPLLEQQLDHPVRLFAYPFGSIGDSGPHAVKESGYTWAVTTRPGVNTSQSDPHLLRRRKMDGKHWLVVATETAGIWSFFSSLKNGVRLLMRRPIYSPERPGQIKRQII